MGLTNQHLKAINNEEKHAVLHEPRTKHAITPHRIIYAD